MADCLIFARLHSSTYQKSLMMSCCQVLRWVIYLCLLLSLPASALSLSADERGWLKARGEVRYCSDPGWMPFEGLDRHGQHIGIGADFIAEFSRQLATPMTRVPAASWAEVLELGRQRQCEFISLTNPSAERSQFFAFTDPYVSLPVVLFGHKRDGYLGGLDALEGQTLAVTRGSVLVSVIRQQAPSVRLKQYATLLEVMAAVMKGEARAAVAALPVGLYLVQKMGLAQLEVAGHTELKMELALAVRNDDPQLISLLNKAVGGLSPRLHDQIMRRWYSVEVKQAQDYTLLLILVALLCLVVAFLIYRNQTSRRFSLQLEKVNARLSDRNQRLEQICQHDYLTGVLNRVSLDVELNRALQRAASQGQPLGLIMLDLDFFGQVNQKYGHQTGDSVLIEVSRVLEQVLPDWVRVGRWSGDQFVLICPRTGIEEVRALCSKVSLTLQLHQYSEEVHISASLCVVLCDGRERAASLMYRLERQLREAKVAGPQQLTVLNQYPGGAEEPAA